MYKIRLLCYSYGDPVPYTDVLDEDYYVLAEAERDMHVTAIEELSDLNSQDEDGNFPERRFATIDDDEHDISIVCYDGEDYMIVTCYDIVEFT